MLWWAPLILAGIRRSRSLPGRVAYVLPMAVMSYVAFRFATEPYVSSKLIMVWAFALVGGVAASYGVAAVRVQCRM